MSEDAEVTRRLCDGIVARAAQTMVADAGADIETVLDRLLTYAAAQAVAQDGSAWTAAAFRQLADRIESGAFAHLEAAPRRSKG